MHPSPSVIIFTSLSGLGFGLMTFLGLGYPNVSGWVAFVFFFIAFALAVGGLLASTFHLGNPQRALKAFTQWRSSWLSREGVVAVAALLVMGLYAALIIFFGINISLLGWVGATLSMVTVYCTSMIYAQLKTVPRWNTTLVPALFLAFALTGGALIAGQVGFAKWALLLLLILQVVYWLLGDKQFKLSGSNIKTATGLGDLGEVRLLESPHSGTNYLLKEMAHQVGRKHAQKLRIIAAICLGILPLFFLWVSEIGHGLAVAVIALHIVGLFICRWLFFAEAEHVVGLYYDRHADKT